MAAAQFDHYPLVAQFSSACSWLTYLSHLQRSPHTIDAYARDLQDYLAFCQQHHMAVETVQKEQIALYIRDMAERPRPHAQASVKDGTEAGFANATMQRRLTAIRLYYDYLTEEGLCPHNPVSRGRYTPGKLFGGARDRGLLPHYTKLPWIPNEEQWQSILDATRQEPMRNRFMFALAYDAGLRREELCSLATTDIEPGKRLVHLRAETTKNHKARIVPYSDPTAQLYTAYLVERRALSRERGPLFLSASRRNHSQPISKWTWTKVVHDIAQRAEVAQFTPHTLRHLCLTDLARAGWDLREIADFAGHSNLDTTRQYIRLSGRDLIKKVETGMASIHAWRIQMMAEASR